MRKVAIGSVALLSAGLALASVAQAQDADEPTGAMGIAGTWSVTSSVTGTRTCPSRTASVDTYIWIVGVTAEGRLTIAVQGTTSFPTLTGTLSGSRVTLQGPGSGASASWFSLTMRGAELVGTRRFLNVENGTACFIDFTVRAHRT